MIRESNERIITADNFNSAIIDSLLSKRNGIVIKSPRGIAPETVEVDGKVYIRTNHKPLTRKQAMFEDHLFKKAKERKEAKKEARKEAKAAGKSRSQIRKAGIAARQSVKAEQVREKAATKTGPRAEKLLKRAEKIEARKGTTVLGKTAKKVGKAYVKTLKTVAVAANLTPLIALMPLMGRALKKKGFTPPKKIADRAELFYNEIIRKSNYSRPQHFNGFAVHDDHLAAEVVTAIITFVKEAITKNKKKKIDPATQLTPVEKLVADEGETVFKEIINKAANAGVDVSVKESQETPTFSDTESGSNELGIQPGSDSPRSDGKGSVSRETESREKSVPGQKKILLYGGLALAALIGVGFIAKK